MALIRCQFYSEVLNLSTSMMVILPQQTTTQIGMKINCQGISIKHYIYFMVLVMMTQLGRGERQLRDMLHPSDYATSSS